MHTLDHKGLVQMLTAQHQTLRTDLSGIKVHFRENKEEAMRSVLADILKFKEDLFTHLKLENETFYVDYLNRKIERNEDVRQLRLFIEQMDVIGRVVTLFLDRYSLLESIRADFEGEFEKRLDGVIDMLSVRMEAEEDSAYKDYLKMFV